MQGKKFSDVLFKSTSLNQDQIKVVESCVLASLNSRPFVFIANSHLLPKELIRKSTVTGRTQILKLDWSSIENGEGRIEKILLVVKDVTADVELEEKVKAQNNKMQIVTEILSINRSAYFDFILL